MSGWLYTWQRIIQHRAGLLWPTSESSGSRSTKKDLMKADINGNMVSGPGSWSSWTEVALISVFLPVEPQALHYEDQIPLSTRAEGYKCVNLKTVIWGTIAKFEQTIQHKRNLDSKDTQIALNHKWTTTWLNQNKIIWNNSFVKNLQERRQLLNSFFLLLLYWKVHDCYTLVLIIKFALLWFPNRK